MAFTNRIRKIQEKINSIAPAFLQTSIISFGLSRYIPYVNTTGIFYEKISPNEVIVRVKNKRKTQNHIKQIHAAATALLAETATGICVGLNLPDDKLPLMKSLKVNYIARSQGWQKATATLSEANCLRIQTEERGDITVPVVLVDSKGTIVVECEMIWAWIPKKRAPLH